MNMQFHCKLPIPMEVKKQYPASEQVLQIVDSYTQQIKDILSGKDERLLLIIGPCSADNSEALLQYCYKLKQVSDKVKSKILINKLFFFVLLTVRYLRSFIIFVDYYFLI